MDDAMKETLKRLGVDTDNADQIHIDQKETVGRIELARMVAELCAEHGDGLVCMFACTGADPNDEDGVAAMMGGSEIDNPQYKECVVTLAGKLFQARYGASSVKQVVVHRDREDEDA